MGLEDLLDRARAAAHVRFGPRVGFHVPGMFVYESRRGRFPAVSLTGGRCELNCLHCRGRLLEGMAPVTLAEELPTAARRVKAAGGEGMLVTGGCDKSGRLPWPRFAEALSEAKRETGLVIAVHSGFVDDAQARLLAQAGVDVVFFDVIADDQTLAAVYGLDRPGLARRSLEALVGAGLRVVPHVVAGLHFGRLKGEEEAVEIIAGLGLESLVFVVFMPVKGTPLAAAAPPDLHDVVRLIARTRLAHPDMRLGLGCAKPRGAYHRDLDRLALMAGVNHLAIPAPAAVTLAGEMGLEATWSENCCGVALAAAPQDMVRPPLDAVAAG